MKRKLAALIIGNANYPAGQELHNSVHDALDVEKKLKEYDFDVVVGTDCSAADMDKKLIEFSNLLDTHDVGLFFFAGHGVQIEGANYLLAIDSDFSSESDVKYSSLPLDKVVDRMSKSDASTKIIVLDACRNNPWERAWNRDISTRGLASVYAPKGTIIGFATSPGEVAADGSGRNGTYTEALLQHIDTKDCPIETMFKRVRNTVAAATNGRQTTWEHTSLAGEFYFNIGINKLIDEYKDTALADGLFALNSSKLSHSIISDLKSYNWYTQNPAILKLTKENIEKLSSNSLFVIGRNIYQAACGSSGEADVFISSFIKKTNGFPEKKRKALLDGMLFEVFFDSTGNLRQNIKKGYFNEVFDLQRFDDLTPSFDFIADALKAAGARFPEIPGTGRVLNVNIVTKKGKKAYIVKAIFVAGKDALILPDGDLDEFEPISPLTRTDMDQINANISDQLAIPQRLLKATYTPATITGDDQILIPRGWRVALD